MAIRTDANADGLVRTANVLNYNNPYTWMAWIRCAAVSASSYNTLFIISDDGTFPNAEGIDWRNTGGNNRLLVYSDDGTYNEQFATTNLTVGTWYHVASVREAAGGGGTIRGYLDGVSDVTIAPAVSRVSAAARMEMGTFNDTDLFNGLYAAVKIWDTNLTAAEVAQERFTIWPQRWANLVGFYPMIQNDTTSVLEDWSGLGRTLTGDGTLTLEDGPPVSMGGGVAPYYSPPPPPPPSYLPPKFNSLNVKRNQLTRRPV